MVFKRFSVLFSLTLYTLYSSQLNEAVVFKLTNAVCESSNKSWVEFHNCRLKAVSRNKVLLNVNATVYEPAKNIGLRVEILKKANGYKPWLFNTTIDACRFQRQSYNPIVMLAFKQVKDFSNLNHTCPFLGSQIVKDLYLRPELLNNLPMPTGEYFLRGTWYFYGKHIANTNFYFEYVEDLQTTITK